MTFSPKNVKDLATMRYKDDIKREILFDMMVCRVKGWNKAKYIKQLKKEINGFDTGRTK